MKPQTSSTKWLTIEKSFSVSAQPHRAPVLHGQAGGLLAMTPVSRRGTPMALRAPDQNMTFAANRNVLGA